MRRLWIASFVWLPCALAAGPDFATQVQPILEKNCVGCHGVESAGGGLKLHTAEGARKGGSRGPAVVPGQPDKSPLYILVGLPPGAPAAMPPAGPRLESEQLVVLHDWIAAGAVWPAGVTLTPGGKAKGKDDEALASNLHTRIVKNSPEKIQAEMKAYQTTVPYTDVSFRMVPIPGGTFKMGTGEKETGHRPDEAPVHEVALEPFWMGEHEVTWDEYRLFMFAQQANENTHKDELVDAVSRPTRPYVEMSFGMGINGFPAISMTQHAANKYAQWLSAKTGQFYRLPTEAEWEYACRAGSTTAYSFGDDASKLGDYAWYGENSNGKYQKVGTKKPNPWGLYDMHGNVVEWTLDQYGPYAAQAAQGPWVKSAKPYPQVVRGGSWNDDPDRLRCGARLGSDASWKMQDPQLPKSIWYHTDAQWLGFRLVRPLKVPGVKEMFQYWNNGVEGE